MWSIPAPRNQTPQIPKLLSRIHANVASKDKKLCRFKMNSILLRKLWTTHSTQPTKIWPLFRHRWTPPKRSLPFNNSNLASSKRARQLYRPHWTPPKTKSKIYRTQLAPAQTPPPPNRIRIKSMLLMSHWKTHKRDCQTCRANWNTLKGHSKLRLMPCQTLTTLMLKTQSLRLTSQIAPLFPTYKPPTTQLKLKWPNLPLPLMFERKMPP